MLSFFNRVWSEVPTAWIDTETTGVRAGFDRAVQVGIVRFEGGRAVGDFVSLVNPRIPIPREVSAIHGIIDDHVAGAPSVQSVFLLADVQRLLRDAQPAAYNGPFDRHFVPPFGEDWAWPWLDALSLVRVVDRFAKGKGRHKLEAACQRNGIALDKAHDAASDARAAGELFYKLAPGQYGRSTLGQVLHRQRLAEAESWFDFHSWLSKQPPLPKENADASHG